MSLRPGTTVFKDPNAEKVYTMDWSDWLVGAAELASSVWTITPPASEPSSALTKDNETDTTTTAQLRLLGGTVGLTYQVTCRVVTNESPAQTDDRSFFVKIQQQ